MLNFRDLQVAASLKPCEATLTQPYDFDFRDLQVAASLKLTSPTFGIWGSRSFPRPAGRGLIEARGTRRDRRAERDFRDLQVAASLKPAGIGPPGRRLRISATCRSRPH